MRVQSPSRRASLYQPNGTPSLQALIAAALTTTLIAVFWCVGYVLVKAYEMGQEDVRREYRVIPQWDVVKAVVAHAEAHRKPANADVIPDFPYPVVDDAQN